MFGAISVKMIFERLHPAQPRQIDEIPGAQRKGLGADGSGRPGPGGKPDKEAFDQNAPDFKIGGNDQQHRQGGNDQDDVGEHIEHFIHHAAAIAGVKPTSIPMRVPSPPPTMPTRKVALRP